MSWRNLRIISARLPTDKARQAGKAAWEAAIASCTSCFVAKGTRAMTVPVLGL